MHYNQTAWRRMGLALPGQFYYIWPTCNSRMRSSTRYHACLVRPSGHTTGNRQDWRAGMHNRIPSITLNTLQMELCLPEEKIQRLTSLIKEWCSKCWCRKRDLESLIGKLHHASTVVNYFTILKHGCFACEAYWSIHLVYKHAARLSQPGHNLVQPCTNHVTTLFQPYHYLVARLLQGWYKLATMLSTHGLRWHGRLSAKVAKNANLGYSHDRGLS